MNVLIEDLLSRASSDDPEGMKEGTLCLAMLIERHSPRHACLSYYNEILPPDVRVLNLQDEDEKQIVLELGRLALAHARAKPILWALSKSVSLDALDALLRFVSTRQEQEQEPAIRQALVGIQPFSTVQKDDNLYQGTRNLFKEYKVGDVLARILSWGDAQTRSLAERIAARLHEQE